MKRLRKMTDEELVALWKSLEEPESQADWDRSEEVYNELAQRGIDLSGDESEPKFIGEVEVTICPPMGAHGCTDLNNRGHSEWPLITCWPRREHNALTTGKEFKGLGIPRPVALTSVEIRMCEILRLEPIELGIFLREWTPIQGDRNFRGQAKTEERPKDLDTLMQAYNRAGKVSRTDWVNRKNRLDKTP